MFSLSVNRVTRVYTELHRPPIVTLQSFTASGLRMRSNRRSSTSRKADAEHTHASVAKAGETIGYEPSRTITEGVGEFIEWYEANREWYEPLVRAS